MGSIGVANGDFFSQLEVNPVTGYYKTENIKKLYHWIEDRSLEYVEQNGITADSDGDVYLSVAPLRGEGGHLYEVTIPDNNTHIRRFFLDILIEPLEAPDSIVDAPTA